MKHFSSAFPLVIALCFSSCASQHIYKGNPTYAQDGQLFCSLHHQKLIHANGFRQSDKVCILPVDDYVKWRLAFPNDCTEYSDKKEAVYFVEPVSYDYCQACRDALSKKLK